MSPQHYSAPGHIHYLTFSCYHHLWLFKSPSLYRAFLHNLDHVRTAEKCKLYGYMVMPNHVHLLIYPPEEISISSLLWTIKRPFGLLALDYLKQRQPELYTKLRVVKGGRIIHRFWQAGGGYDRNIFRDDSFRQKLDYMHQNPVRKQLVKSPEAWTWSSAGFYLTRKAGVIKVDWPEWWEEYPSF